MDTQTYNYQESLRILKCLVLEIQNMDEAERSNTLRWIMQLEAEEEGDQFWLLIVKYLLSGPEQFSDVLNLVERELIYVSDITLTRH